jgi:hypothetical protein
MDSIEESSWHSWELGARLDRTGTSYKLDRIMEAGTGKRSSAYRDHSP